MIIFDDLDVKNLLLTLRPDIHARAQTIQKRLYQKGRLSLSYGGKIAIVGDEKDHSTREMIRQIRSMEAI